MKLGHSPPSYCLCLGHFPLRKQQIILIYTIGTYIGTQYYVILIVIVYGHRP